ncbi:EVE domain-containing protein [Candidatus Berkelbacteria bacterium]|nr:EVE domain-containing protein [Candidatus Berkelbacteria bacterium]
MAVFLLKTEPNEYSLDDLAQDGVTVWSGVRNPTAIRTIRTMCSGDRALIYHSGKNPAIVGCAQVISDPRPDPTDTRSWQMDVQFLERYETPVTLAAIKTCGLFDDWALVRQGRLSTMPVPDDFLRWFWPLVQTS